MSTLPELENAPIIGQFFELQSTAPPPTEAASTPCAPWAQVNTRWRRTLLAHPSLSHAAAQSQFAAQRCRVVTWNSGGLTTAKLAEIELWLDDCQQQGSTIHICILTETHWSFTSEWSLRSYHAVHSGLSNRRAGILALIHKQYMPGPSIRFSEPIPGRLLLLRLESSPATYVVCTYQFVWNETPSV